jgi:hypothetical protein
MIEPNFTEKIDCPCKKGGNAFRDSFDKIEVSLCSTCGLMTTSQYLEDSEEVEQIKALCPPEMMFISIVDERGFRTKDAENKFDVLTIMHYLTKEMF